MRNVNVLGLIFANIHDEYLPRLSASRSIGSVPFAGRYRFIDFQLSNLVNSGIAKVGIISKKNSYSLMDHIGSGKAWDLSRKTEGLYFLPPSVSNDELYKGKISSLLEIRSFFKNAKEDYVILTDCNVIGNIDYDRLIDAHIESKADITIAYKRGEVPKVDDNLLLGLDDSGGVIDLNVGTSSAEIANFGIGLFIMRRELLRRLIDNCIGRNLMSFEKDILQNNINSLNIRGYHVPEMILPVYSHESYFKASLSVLDKSVRDELFLSGRPIYTKVRDAAPGRYGLQADVSNSLIADGSLIEGTVKNSILFRDVRVGKNAVVENSIIMQGSIICDNARLSGVVLDKDVVIRNNRVLSGTENFPVFVDKGLII